jgi:glycosyltransferase involved in cell wall biosynthesis
MGEKTDMKMTAIVISKNDANLLGRCLDQLDWVDQLVVVDNQSTDNSVQIAQTKQATVIIEKKEDFSALRNAGAQAAVNDWLLYIDTDEVISAKLRQEIQGIMLQSSTENLPVAYTIKRQNYYLGHLWPAEDGMIRFIYKPALVSWQGKLHETAIIHGQIGVLQNRLIHHTHRSLEQMVEKTNHWSKTEAALRFQANHPPIVAWRLARVMLTGFFDSYIRQQGWRAGTVGVIESLYQAFSLFITYAKVWEMQQTKDKGRA